MRILILLALLAGLAPAGELALVAIRNDPRQLPDIAPPRTKITIDIFRRGGLVDVRHVTILDPAMRARLVDRPFIVPSTADRAWLVVADDGGLRSLQISWSRSESVGKSQRIACSSTFLGRPLQPIPDRIALFSKDAMLTFDLQHGKLARTSVRNPLSFDVALSRIYVAVKGGIGFHPVLAADPPSLVTRPPQLLIALPDRRRVERAVVGPDATRVAYTEQQAHRFVLSVADQAKRLLVRRSIPGRLYDLRWIDAGELLVTATRGEHTWVHALTVGTDHLTSTKLEARYLAPPEIVPVERLALRRKS